jgi:hypothetical protein
MKSQLKTALLICALWVNSALSGSAQDPLDRPVGPSVFNLPVTILRIDAGFLARLSWAGGLALGFEGLPPLDRTLHLVATGKTMRTVLDAIVEIDPRYEWRLVDGVVLIRPVDPNQRNPLLNRTVSALKLDSV